MPGRLTAGQQAGLPRPEQRQVSGQRGRGRPHVRGRVLGEPDGGDADRAAALGLPLALEQAAATSGSRTGTSKAWPGGQCWLWVVTSTAVPGRVH